MQLFLNSVMQPGENFQSSPRGSIINITLVCCHTKFSCFYFCSLLQVEYVLEEGKGKTMLILYKK